MSNMKTNDWEIPVSPSKIKEKQDYNLTNIYNRAHSELSLQQSKRDQIITIYLALCSFLLPFALGEELIIFQLKGLIFLVVGILGMLFSLITVRYREYKEVYWMCCQALTVLQSFKPDEIDKHVVQNVFYHSLYKKGRGFLKTKKNGAVKLNKFKYFKKNVFSAETMHFAIISIMSGFVTALGVALLSGLSIKNSIIIGIPIFASVLAFLLAVYFLNTVNVYRCLAVPRGDCATERNKAFNKTFSKAWFLHFYYDPKKTIKKVDMISKTDIKIV